MLLWWSTTDEKAHTTVAGEELNDRTKLNVGEWSVVALFSAIRPLAHVATGNYAIVPLSGVLQWSYHCFFIKSFDKDDLLKRGGILPEK